MALAQSGGGSGAGSDVSTPRQNQVRPTPASPPVNRRGDEMAPMQGSNVSAQPWTQTQGKTDKHKVR